jgi:hypothetical protein
VHFRPAQTGANLNGLDAEIKTPRKSAPDRLF